MSAIFQSLVILAGGMAKEVWVVAGLGMGLYQWLWTLLTTTFDLWYTNDLCCLDTVVRIQIVYRGNRIG